jgi:hypothetical protein
MARQKAKHASCSQQPIIESMRVVHAGANAINYFHPQRPRLATLKETRHLQK